MSPSPTVEAAAHGLLLTEPEQRWTIIHLLAHDSGWPKATVESYVAKLEAAAVATERARLRAAMEGLTGYTDGMTIDGDDVWSGMEASDAEPGSIQHKGDWLQRGPILALLEEQP